MKAIVTRRPWVVIIFVAIVVAAVLIASRERSTPLTRPERAWVVDVATVARQTLKPTRDLFGSLKSPQDAERSSGVDSSGLLGQLERFIESQKESFDIDRRLDRLQRQIESAINEVISLIVIYLLKTLLVPLATLAVLYGSIRHSWRSSGR